MGPNSNSNQWFGTKVSQVGTPVNQASDTQLIYKSNFSTNLFNGPGGVWKVMEGTRVPTIGNGLTAPQQGFWVAEDGVDVQQATDAQMIFNSNGNPTILGYAQITSSFSGSIFPTFDDIVGLSVTVNIPNGHAIKLTAAPWFMLSTLSGGNGIDVHFFDVNASLEVGGTTYTIPTAGYAVNGLMTAVVFPPGGIRTYKLQYRQPFAATFTYEASPTIPAYILVEDLGPVPTQ